MNFLSEVLSSAEQTGLENCRKNLPIISGKIAACKEEINKYINDVYYEFSEWPKKNQELLDNATRLSTEMHNLQNQAEELTVKEVAKKTEELDSLTTELEESNIALSIVLNLVQIHESLMNVKDFQNQNLYLKAASELVQIEECIKATCEDETTEAIEALKSNVLAEKAILMEKVNKQFEDYVKIIQGKPGHVQTNSIKIRKECPEFTDMLTILGLFEELTIPLNKFSKLLWKFICEPIIGNLTVVKVEEECDFHILNVVIKKVHIKNRHKDVFHKLIEVFGFLHAHFNYQIDEDRKTMAYIGNQIKLDFSEGFLKNCLGNTLPEGDDDYTVYKQVIEDTKAFQTKLVKFEVFCENANPLLDYTRNMDLLFVNKKCQEYSAAAINIMKKDLHDMVEVGVTQDRGAFLIGCEFPESCVSRSAIDLLELTRNLLQQALQETDVPAARLICAAQSVFYQYATIVSGHHEKLLQTIPQQVVLFRNNCMYLAHQLTQFNEAYSGKFSAAVLPVPPIFKDQGHQLRTIGGDTFLGYVEDHIKSMELTLEQYQVSHIQLCDRLHPDTDKCLRQCIRQYELLKTVWHKVLPHAVYNKTMGYMLNSFCKKLVDVVLLAADIPSKNSEQLVEMYKVMLTRGPKLFTEPQEVGLYVESWQKLNEVVFVLSTNLASLVDRWAEGKGPLALQFTPDELKGLIRSLFQNTDRRAAALSKIK